MEFQQVIEKRRSMRQFDPDKKIDQEMLKQLVSAAILAPSWKNSQTARYYGITSESMLTRFKQECLPQFNANNVKDAPALLVTSFVKNRSGYEKTGEPTNELENGWGAYDLGLHNANLVLKATDLGLDTVIMGIRDEKKIREMLSINEKEIIVAVIGVGYGIAEPSIPKRKTPEDILTFF